MKKRKTKYIAVLCALSMVSTMAVPQFFANMAVSAYAAETVETWESGNCTVTFDADGVLTVSAKSGTDGTMADYEWDKETKTYPNAPWKEDADKIVKIVVKDGVSHISGLYSPNKTHFINESSALAIQREGDGDDENLVMKDILSPQLQSLDLGKAINSLSKETNTSGFYPGSYTEGLSKGIENTPDLKYIRADYSFFLSYEQYASSFSNGILDIQLPENIETFDLSTLNKISIATRNNQETTNLSYVKNLIIREPIENLIGEGYGQEQSRINLGENLSRIEVKDQLTLHDVAFSGETSDLDWSNVAIETNGPAFTETIFDDLRVKSIKWSNRWSNQQHGDYIGTQLKGSKLWYYGTAPEFTGEVKDFYWMTEDVVSSFMKVEYIPETTTIHGLAGSSVETWCKNNNRVFVPVTEEELNGRQPSMELGSYLYDAKQPEDVSVKVDLGLAPAGAKDIKRVLIDNEDIPFEFNGSDAVVLKMDSLNTLKNGEHTISVLFDNNVFKSGAKLTVLNSKVQNGEETLPPEALTTIKYEFYKDYPDTIVIPVKLNAAHNITQLKIGNDVVDPQYYELQEGAILLNKEFLSTLDAGKYRVLPTFDDAANTTISNIQLIVYNKAADRAAPYLLHSVIKFTGQDVAMTFDYGEGDLLATNVLALVLDDDIILPNGDKLPFSKSNVNAVRNLYKEYSAVDDFEEVVEDDIDVATASIPEKNVRSQINIATASTPEKSNALAFKVLKAAESTEQVFSVDGNKINFSGEYISSLNLKTGEHLIGAIFDNTEKTTDIKKVVLEIPGSESKPENPDNENKPENPDNGNKPENPDEGNKPENPDKPENPNQPENPEKPDEGNKPSGGNGGGNGGGGSTGSASGNHTGNGNNSDSGPGTQNPSVILPDGSLNPNFKPSVPGDTAGDFSGSGNDWVFVKPDGTIAKDEWIASKGDWYHVDEEGKMQYGWFLDDDTNKWYVLNTEHNGKFGACLYGWYYEKQDGKWYFLNPKNGEMLTDWQFISGAFYYFTPSNGGQTYFGDNLSGWKYDATKEFRPYGSMYVNEKTPNGFYVDANGAYVK